MRKIQTHIPTCSDSCSVLGPLWTLRVNLHAVNYAIPNACLLLHNPFIVAKDSEMYDPTAIKILDIKVPMPGTVKEM